MEGEAGQGCREFSACEGNGKLAMPFHHVSSSAVTKMAAMRQDGAQARPLRSFFPGWLEVKP